MSCISDWVLTPLYVLINMGKIAIDKRGGRVCKSGGPTCLWKVGQLHKYDWSLYETLLLLHRVVNTASISFVVSDPRLPDNPIVFHNPAFEYLTGYDSGEIDGRNCRFPQGADTDPEAVAELRRAIAEERPCRMVLLNYRKTVSPSRTSCPSRPSMATAAS